MGERRRYRRRREWRRKSTERAIKQQRSKTGNKNEVKEGKTNKRRKKLEEREYKDQ